MLVNAFDDNVCRRRLDGSDVKLFLLCSHERLREGCARSLASALAPLCIAVKEEELESGGVG